MDTRSNIHRTAQIVFFSGTGGVKRVALAFEHELIHRGLDVSLNVLAGNIRRTPCRKGAFKSLITKLEKQGSYRFAQKLKIGKNCTGCGWCAEHCPVNNIGMQDLRPVFKDRCVICFRCVYGCPFHAIRSNNFMVMKKGFNLEETEKRMQGVALIPVEKCCRGFLWKDIRKYLLDDGGNECSKRDSEVGI